MEDQEPYSTPSFGRYRVVATLGHGGMAEVFLAVAQGPAGFNKLVVIKRLRPNLAEDNNLADMFLDEARLAARLNHKNVVQTNEVDLASGEYFMAMEYLDGQPLHRVLGRAREMARPISLAIISRILCDMLAGLHYAHELADYDGTPLRIVHRDVSPQNVFVTYDGVVKIVDFGIAKAARRAVETETGVIKGKIAYMAPEQAFASSEGVDRRADVFSVGVMLWELLAGRRLWGNKGAPEIIASLVRDIPRLAVEKPGVDPALAGICDRALSLLPEARFATAADFRAALEQAAPPASADQVSAFVERLFEDQRAEIRALIARQVDRVVRGGASDLLKLDRGSLPRDSLPDIVPKDSPSRPGRPISLSPASLASGVSSETPITMGAPTPKPISTASAGDSGDSAHTPIFEHTARTSIGRSWLMIVGLIAVVGGLATLLLAPGREPPRTASPASSAPLAPVASLASVDGGGAAPLAQTASTSAAPSTGAPAGDFIMVRVRASPPDAKLLVDGAALPSNPFDGKFVKDGAVHRVQVESTGFLSQTRLVVFDKDQAIDFALQPKPKSVDSPGMKPDPYK